MAGRPHARTTEGASAGTRPSPIWAGVAPVRDNPPMNITLRAIAIARGRSLAVVLGLVVSTLVPTLGASVAAAPTVPAPGAAPPAGPGAGSGTWPVTTGWYTGYRVITDVLFVGRQTIAGRTSAVTGSAQIRLVSGRERLTAARFTADLRKAT